MNEDEDNYFNNFQEGGEGVLNSPKLVKMKILILIKEKSQKMGKEQMKKIIRKKVGNNMQN